MEMTLNVDTINYPQRRFSNNKNQKVRNIDRLAASVGTGVGVAYSLASVTKTKPSKMLKVFKNPTKAIDVLKKLELSGMDVIKIATGSIAGGFVGGSLVDRKNTKAKAKEGIVQLIGNYIIPSLFVTGGIKLNKVLNKNFKFPPKTGIVQFAFGMASLVAGVFAGNKIAKEVNKDLFQENAYRPLNWKDWSMQFDNVCLVTSVANPGTNLAKTVSKAIPVAHLIPGYLTGVKKNNG